MGINDTGELNFGFNPETGLPFGIALAGVGDGISPGCLCEGWGVAVNGTISGGASQSNAAPGNLTLSPFTSTASTATSVVTLTTLRTLSVTQAYAPSASSALFQNTVTITNTGAAVTDLLYTRVMDWDIPPTPFSELVTIKGVGATNLVFFNDNGFSNVDPLTSADPEIVAGTTNVNFTDSGPADHGAYFKFNFGSLAADSSKTFNIFYGATGSEAAALAALGTVGAEVYSLGQSDGSVLGSDFTTGTPGTFIFGFAGVGGTPLPPPDGTVPEPSTLLLSLLGLGMSALRLRKWKTS